jgi:hypothetical protein
MSFTPEDYMIVGSISIAGITYSRGESLPPTVREADIERLLDSGELLKKGDSPAVPRPGSAQDYLRGTDVIVLQSITTHRPNAAVLHEMAEMARQANRSPVLVGALEVAAEYAEGSTTTPRLRTAESPRPVEEDEEDEEQEEDEEPEDEEDEEDAKDTQRNAPKPTPAPAPKPTPVRSPRPAAPRRRP